MPKKAIAIDKRPGVIPPLRERGSPSRKNLAEKIRSHRLIDHFSAGEEQLRKIHADLFPAPRASRLGWWNNGSIRGYKRIFTYSPLGKKFEKFVELNSTGNFLDIGAGSAHYWLPLIKRSKNKLKVTALNISRFLIPPEPISLRVGLIETARLGLRKFDGILCSYGGLDKTDHFSESILKTAHALKPKGLAYIILGRPVIGDDLLGYFNFSPKKKEQSTIKFQKRLEEFLGPSFKIDLRISSERQDILITRLK